MYGELSDFERALECFEDGLRRRTRYVPLILGKARTLRLLGQPSAARRFLLERHTELPEHDQRLLGIDLGWTAIELRDWNEACRRLDDLSDPSVLRGRVAAACGAKKPVPELEEIAHQGGEHASVCFELGRCYVARRDLNTGRREFDTARALARGPEELLLLLVSEAETLIDAGALTEASATVRDAIALEEGRFEKDPTVLAVRGRLLHAAGDGAAAQRVFQAALRAWPRSQTAKVGLALAEFESGHQASARRLLAELVEACPENLAAKQVFAWMLVASHESDQELSASGWLGRAASLCNQILAKEPAICEPYRCLSMISALEGRGRAAQLYLDQAASLDSDGAHLDPDRGAVHLQLRQYDKARAALERAMQGERTDGRVPFLLGALTLEQGDAAGAVPYFREAAAFEPRNAGFHCALATALEQAKEHDDALTSLTNGLALVTERTRIPLHLARVRILHSMARAADKPEEEALLTAAMRDVERSKTLARTHADKADVAYHRGVILHGQGAVDGARKAFRSAIRQANGDHPEARHALAMLGEERRGDPNERLARRAAYALAGVAFVLLLAAIALGFVEAQGQDIFDAAWLPVVGVLLGLIGLAGVLPRLAGVKFKGFELTVAQPVAGPMPARVELGFRPVPLLMLSGLTPHRQPQPAPDLEGEPGG